MYPICSVMITFDSTKAITVTKKDDREYYIKMYSLETYDMVFEEKVGGDTNDYIKLKEVEQNSSGKHYAIVYNNDGWFYLRDFYDENRSQEEISANELDINKVLGIDNWSMAIQGFADPYITCAFIDDDRIFVNLFHNYSLVHWHFIYNLKTREV